MISVIWNNPSVIDGRISALSPLAVRNPVDHQPSATTSPRPNDGSTLRTTAKNRMSRIPVRKVGIEMPIKEMLWKR